MPFSTAVHRTKEHIEQPKAANNIESWIFGQSSPHIPDAPWPLQTVAVFNLVACLIFVLLFPEMLSMGPKGITEF